MGYLFYNLQVIFRLSCICCIFCFYVFGGGHFHLAILFCHFNPNPKFREFHMCIHLCDLTPYRYLAGSIMHLSCHFPLPHLPILCTQTSSLCSSVSQGLTSGQTVPHSLQELQLLTCFYWWEIRGDFWVQHCSYSLHTKDISHY